MEWGLRLLKKGRTGTHRSVTSQSPSLLHNLLLKRQKAQLEVHQVIGKYKVSLQGSVHLNSCYVSAKKHGHSVDVRYYLEIISRAQNPIEAMQYLSFFEIQYTLGAVQGTNSALNSCPTLSIFVLETLTSSIPPELDQHAASVVCGHYSGEKMVCLFIYITYKICILLFNPRISKVLHNDK